MQKQEMSATQLRDLNIFHLILECNGWDDPSDTEDRLDAGEDVKPEGYRIWRDSHIVLHARFHAPVNMISLTVSDQVHKEKIQFHFLYEQAPEKILEWIVTVQEDLRLETYPGLLKQADGKCEMILLEISESEIYEVKPPANAPR